MTAMAELSHQRSMESLTRDTVGVTLAVYGNYGEYGVNMSHPLYGTQLNIARGETRPEGIRSQRLFSSEGIGRQGYGKACMCVQYQYRQRVLHRTTRRKVTCSCTPLE